MSGTASWSTPRATLPGLPAGAHLGPRLRGAELERLDDVGRAGRVELGLQVGVVAGREGGLALAEHDADEHLQAAAVAEAGLVLAEHAGEEVLAALGVERRPGAAPQLGDGHRRRDRVAVGVA